MELLIRNMVCRHCVKAVTMALESVGLDVADVTLGRAEIREPALDATMLETVRNSLADQGFELISDPDDVLTERIRHAVQQHVRSEDECRLKLSVCLERRLGVGYDTISRVFSRKEGRTVEKYYIAQKIERVKELLGYRELSLGEIAFRTGYSSVSHLSRQFKEYVGVTTSEFVRDIQSAEARKGINEV